MNNIYIVCIYVCCNVLLKYFFYLLSIKHVLDETEKKETLDKIMKARKRVQEQTALYKNRLVNLRKTIDTFQNEIYALQSQCCSSSLN